MKHITAHQISFEQLSFDLTDQLDIAKSLCILLRDPEDLENLACTFDPEVVEIARKTAFFEWAFESDSCGVYQYCTLVINSSPYQIDGGPVGEMRQIAQDIARKQGCEYFIETTEKNLHKAYNAARLSNRAEREFNTYCR